MNQMVETNLIYLCSWYFHKLNLKLTNAFLIKSIQVCKQSFLQNTTILIREVNRRYHREI